MLTHAFARYVIICADGFKRFALAVLQTEAARNHDLRALGEGLRYLIHELVEFYR